jgi:hypothetical protein
MQQALRYSAASAGAHAGRADRLDHDVLAVVADQLSDERAALRLGHALLEQQRLADGPELAFVTSAAGLAATPPVPSGTEISSLPSPFPLRSL